VIPVPITAADAPHLQVREVLYAEKQPPYKPLPTLVEDGGRVISRWKLEPNDLLLIQNGVDIYLTLYTFGGPLQPIMMTVGPPARDGGTA
jgi:hypothetical protein